MSDTPAGQSAGPSTDRHNEPVQDPSPNVLDLVEAAVKRTDDLRVLDSHWRDRLERREVDHAWEMRKAESDRIDAILVAASANVQRAADVQSGVADRLAVQVSETATAFEGRLRAALSPVEEAIADLRRSQYQDVGAKTQVVETRLAADDLAPLLSAIRRLEANQSERVGGDAQVVQTRAAGSSIGLWLGLAFAAFSLFLAFVGTAVAIIVLLTR